MDYGDEVKALDKKKKKTEKFSDPLPTALTVRRTDSQ